MKQHYFDYAASTPMDTDVLAAMQPYLTTQFYNPSAEYLAAKEVRQALEHARTTVSRVLGTRPSEVYFTAGGTEANNMALQGIMRQYPDANVVVSAIEHSSVLEPAKLFDAQIAPVSSKGIIDLAALEKRIDEKTVLVSIMYANNEIGTVQPIRKIANFLQFVREERRKKGNKLPLFLHTDACQAANYLDLHVSRLGVDLMTLNGSKIYGPKQSGALYVRAGIVLQPLVLGGGQEHGLRSGTENVAGAVGFAAALQKTEKVKRDESDRLKQLRDNLISQLWVLTPNIKINGHEKLRLPNNIHVLIPDCDNERLVMELDERGIICAAGSACSASSEEPSHVLKAIGLSDKDAQSSIRITMGRGTTLKDTKTLAEVLTEVLQ
jgi:cysteine desulfurase